MLAGLVICLGYLLDRAAIYAVTHVELPLHLYRWQACQVIKYQYQPRTPLSKEKENLSLTSNRTSFRPIEVRVMRGRRSTFLSSMQSCISNLLIAQSFTRETKYSSTLSLMNAFYFNFSSFVSNLKSSHGCAYGDNCRLFPL
jgi:hypothetical protein